MKPVSIKSYFSLIFIAATLLISCTNPFTSSNNDIKGKAISVVLEKPVPVTSFVSIKDGAFNLDGKPFYFAGTNNYYFMYKSNFMIDSVLRDAGRMGVKVIRSWAFMDGASHDGYSLQPELGVYSDSGLERLDYAIYRAKQNGIRLIFALVNYWSDFGGMPQYISWLKLNGYDDFYTAESARNAYKNYVSHILNHVNRYTGVKYKDEPAIMGWNLTNEARNSSDSTGSHLVSWAKEMSDYLHGIAPNHLISLGDEGFYNIYNDEKRGLTIIGNNDTRKGHQEYNGGAGADFNAIIDLPNIHYGVLHNYAQDWWSKDEAWSIQWVKDHINSAKRVNKPVILEEFSRKSVSDSERARSMKLQSDIIENEGGAATMSWMLVSSDDSGVSYRQKWDDGFQICYGDITADYLTEHAIRMWNKNGLGSSPCVDIPMPDYKPALPIKIENFDNYASNAELASAWSKNSSGNSISGSLSSGLSNSTKSMNIAWTLGNPSYAGLIKSLTQTSKNWVGATGLRLSLEADQNIVGRHLTIQFKEDTGEYWESNIALESGLKAIFIPFSSFKHPSWSTSGNNQVDLGGIGELSLYLGGTSGQGTLKIDEIYADAQAEVPSPSLGKISDSFTFGSSNTITIPVNYNDTSLQSIRRESYTLLSPQDYAISGPNIILSNSFLAQLPSNSSTRLSFFFSSGKILDFDIIVSQASVSPKILISNLSYTQGSPSVPTIAIEWNGKSLSSIKNDGTTLSQSQYSIYSSGVILQAAYLDSLSSPFTGILTLTFSDNSSGTLGLSVSPKVITEAKKASVQYHNAQVADSTNQSKPEIKLTNTGTSSIALKDLKIRYWLTNETNAQLQATIWWVNKGQSSIQSQFGANYLELSWPTSTESLNPGEFIQIHLGINANNWSIFSQLNDYSYDSSAINYVTTQKITARILGILVSGIEP